MGKHLTRWTKHIIRGWLLLVWPPIVFIHYAFLNLPCMSDVLPCWNNEQINVFVSYVFPLGGVVAVIVGINANMSLFNLPNLVARPIQYIKDTPITGGEDNYASIGGTAQLGEFSSLKLQGKLGPPQDLEGKVEWLINRMNEVDVHLREDINTVRMNLKVQIRDLQKQTGKINNNITELKSNVVEMSIGGYKVQVFGAMLVVYGTAVAFYS